MQKAVQDGCSPFSLLPEDVVVEIYNKVMDLKTLCYCQLISKRLGLIVFQADTISFNVPLQFDYENENCSKDMKMLKEFLYPHSHTEEVCSACALYSDSALLGSDSFPSAIKFIKRFTMLKSICIQFPPYVNVVADVDDDGNSLFKWMFKFGTRADSLAIQAKNSENVLDLEDELEIVIVREVTDADEERYNESDKTCACLMDVVDRLKKVLGCAVEFPLLEKLFIMDSNESGIITLIGGQGDDLRKFLHLYGTSEHLLVHKVKCSYGSITYWHRGLLIWTEKSGRISCINSRLFAYSLV